MAEQSKFIPAPEAGVYRYVSMGDQAELFDKLLQVAERHKLKSFSAAGFAAEFHPLAFVPADLSVPTKRDNAPGNPNEMSDEEKLLFMSSG